MLLAIKNNDHAWKRSAGLCVAKPQTSFDKSNLGGQWDDDVVKPSRVGSGWQQKHGYDCLNAALKPLADTWAIRRIAEHSLAFPFAKQWRQSVAISVQRARVEVKAKLFVERSVHVVWSCPSI